MRKFFSLKRILLILLAAFILMQFFRIDTNNPPSSTEKDLIAITKPSADVASLLHEACYDCHSNDTKYPWYSQIAPVSWWLKDHINEGRSELNFSEWSDYEAVRKSKKIKYCINNIRKKEMPLDSYTWMHANARLSDNQRQMLIAYFESIR